MPLNTTAILTQIRSSALDRAWIEAAQRVVPLDVARKIVDGNPMLATWMRRGLFGIAQAWDGTTDRMMWIQEQIRERLDAQPWGSPAPTPEVFLAWIEEFY